MPSSHHLLATVLLGAALTGLVGAEEPRPSAAPGRSPRAEREQRPARELLRELPEEQRRQVLRALKKIWEDEDVCAAREQLHAATENYKRTIQTALSEADPELAENVRPLLKRLLNEGGAGPGGPGPERRDRWERGPGSEQARFLRMLGLARERVEALAPEERQRLNALREEVMNDPRVQAAAAQTRAIRDASGNPPPDRDAKPSDNWLQAMKAWRDAVRTVAMEKEPRLKEWIGRGTEGDGNGASASKRR